MAAHPLGYQAYFDVGGRFVWEPRSGSDHMTDRRPCDPPDPIEVVECEATPGEVVGRAVDLAVDLAFFTASTVAECIGAILGGRR